MADDTNWEKLYDYFMIIFYTVAIAVTSGFGIFFLQVAWLEDPVIESMLWSYAFSTGFAMIFMLSEAQNKRRKYSEEDEENE